MAAPPPPPPRPPSPAHHFQELYRTPSWQRDWEEQKIETCEDIQSQEAAFARQADNAEAFRNLHQERQESGHYDELEGEIAEMYNRIAEVTRTAIQELRQIRMTIYDLVVPDQVPPYHQTQVRRLQDLIALDELGEEVDNVLSEYRKRDHELRTRLEEIQREWERRQKAREEREAADLEGAYEVGPEDLEAEEAAPAGAAPAPAAPQPESKKRPRPDDEPEGRGKPTGNPASGAGTQAYSFSEDDIRKLIGDVPIYRYPELAQFDTPTGPVDMFKGKKAVALLFLTESKDMGHWIAVLDHPTNYEVFDSFGVS